MHITMHTTHRGSASSILRSYIIFFVVTHIIRYSFTVSFTGQNLGLHVSQMHNTVLIPIELTSRMPTFCVGNMR